MLNLCLTLMYLVQRKTLQTTTRKSYGRPVYVVVAENVMQNIEEKALFAYKQTVPLWLPYIHDKRLTPFTNTLIFKTLTYREFHSMNFY